MNYRRVEYDWPEWADKTRPEYQPGENWYGRPPKQPRRVPIARRMAADLREQLDRGLDYVVFDYRGAARRYDCCLKTVRNAKRALAGKPGEQMEFVFERKRVGRSFLTIIRLPSSQNSGCNVSKGGGFPNGKKKNTNTGRDARRGGSSATASPQGASAAARRDCPEAGDGRTAGAARKTAEIAAARGRAVAQIARLAFFIARHRLLPLHWDNCKVRPGFGHALNFARQALRAGHRAENIVSAYDHALHQRHKDATDCGLKFDDPAMIWEPSSTVTLARQMLASRFPGDADARRAEMRREIAARPKTPTPAISDADLRAASRAHFAAPFGFQRELERDFSP